MDVGMDVGRLLDWFLIDFGTVLGGKLAPSWHQNQKKRGCQNDVKKCVEKNTKISRKKSTKKHPNINLTRQGTGSAVYFSLCSRVCFDLLRYAWQCLVMLGYASLCLAVLDYAWHKHSALFVRCALGCASIFFDMLCYAWLCLTLLGYAWRCVAMLYY